MIFMATCSDMGEICHELKIITASYSDWLTSYQCVGALPYVSVGSTGDMLSLNNPSCEVMHVGEIERHFGSTVTVGWMRGGETIRWTTASRMALINKTSLCAFVVLGGCALSKNNV